MADGTDGIDYTLDHELFNHDLTEIDILKVITKIWHQRHDLAAVGSILDTLGMFLDEKKVFKDVEFYLPQLTHLIVHFDQYNKVQSLEKFLVLLSQTSIHVALQIMLVLNSFMEDYQTEGADGIVNPRGDSFYFSKCARLLVDVERAAVYGNTILSEAEREMIKQADESSRRLSSSSLDIEDLKRTEIAEELSRIKTEASEGSSHSGELLYKRSYRKSLLHTKGWKVRFFTVENKCLLCYREQYSPDSLRAMYLQYCRVVVPDNHPKYPDTYFEVVNDHTQIVFHLRANSAAERDHWVQLLSKEIQGAPAALEQGLLSGEKGVGEPSSPSPSSTTATAAAAAAAASPEGKPELRTQSSSIVEKLLSTDQHKNFKIIQQQQLFVVNLTNICEALRFRERAVRKFLLRGAMSELVTPPFAYIPLCSSQDPFACILRAIPEEAHAFTTKARVPCLMMFELQEHPTQCDIATFFGLQLASYSEETVVDKSISLVKKCAQVAESSDSANPCPKPVISRFLPHHLGNVESVWKPVGTGQRRLHTHMSSQWVDNGSGRGTNANGTTRPISVGSRGSGGSGSRPDSLDGLSSASSAAAATPNGIGTLSIPDSPCIGESFEEKSTRVLSSSPNKAISGRRLGGLIAKSNDDVRQEVFVVQLIAYYRRAFIAARLPLWLKEYRILSCSKSTGLIEFIPNTSSLDGLKKHDSYPGSLRAYFERTYGYDASNKSEPESPQFKTAMNNFVSSMAAYSVVTYLLAIKDRHNGNIMLDSEGHVIHIDFGFVFGLAPGKQLSMEKAPWKLTVEMVETMGGLRSHYYEEYVARCTIALREARRHAEPVCVLMAVMSYKSNYPAFRYNPRSIQEFRSRLLLNTTDSDLHKEVEQLIAKSYNHTGTNLYDRFQLQTNGIVI